MERTLRAALGSAGAGALAFLAGLAARSLPLAFAHLAQNAALALALGAIVLALLASDGLRRADLRAARRGRALLAAGILGGTAGGLLALVGPSGALM